MHHQLYLFIFTFLVTPFHLLEISDAQSTLCRTSCGGIPINYPFAIDDGCGSLFYRHLLVCDPITNVLELRTPSGRYPVKSISYSDPHIILTDPYMWGCRDGPNFRPTRPFSLDTSTRLTISSQNEFLFFNCSESNVIMDPKPLFCERYPERCDSTCDPASYLCRHLPGCASALANVACCAYYPKATESMRMMLKYCTTYTSAYWRDVEGEAPYKQVAEYGIRVNFDVPVTESCFRCQDKAKGGGTCGFEVGTQEFLCLCEKGNVTTYCKDRHISIHGGNAGAIAGTVTGLSVAGAVGVGAGIWYLKKVRAKAPVTCGVQSTENRIF